MEEQANCALCGNAIGVGQAWMEADDGGAHLRAHAECLYREGQDGEARAWEPQDHSAV
jgi:hypothetical protein